MPEFDEAAKPGTFYEDCRWHPMVCVSVDEKEDEGVGISMITGDTGSCSLRHCGVVSLTPHEAVQRRISWDQFVEERGLKDYSSSHHPRD